MSGAPAPPPFGWLRGYRGGDLRANLLAGLAVAVTAIPDALAFAEVAGLPLAAGLWALVLPPLAYWLVARGPRVSLGLAAPAAVLVADANQSAPADVALARAAAMSVMVAALFALAGALRLGFLARAVSRPILSGIALGVFVVLLSMHLPDLLGIDAEAPTAALRLAKAIRGGGAASGPTLAVAAAAFALLLLGRRVGGRVVAGAMALGGATLLVHAAGWEGSVAVVGALDRLPRPAWSALSPAVVADLLPWAAVVFVVLAVESVELGRGVAMRAQETFDVDRQLLALSAGNAAAALSSTVPIAGSTSATMATERAGGRTPLVDPIAAIVTALALLAGQAFRHLPRPAIAAVSIAAAGALLRPRVLVAVARFDRRELLLAATGFTATVAVGPVAGILLATGLGLLLLVRWASQERLVELGTAAGPPLRIAALAEDPAARVVPGVLLLRHHGALLTLNAEPVAMRVRALVRRSPIRPRAALLDLRAVHIIDFTAAQMLRELREALAGEGVTLAFAGGRHAVRRALARAGLDAAPALPEDARALHALLDRA